MLPVYLPYIDEKEKEYLNQCIDSTWISSKGEFISKFENRFSDYIGAGYSTTVCNGTVALHLAMIALGIGCGDEVIVPTLTYVASVNTIVQTGATPIFVDSLQSTLQMDTDDVLLKITPRTKAIMAVHLYGLPCDMDSLVKICQDRGIFLIEDCAEAFGTYYKNQHVGTFGAIATFSFFGNKTITTGEGGMVVTNSKELFQKAYHLKNQGVSLIREYWHDVVAYNYRMTNVCAAIGLAQLEKADLILDKKRHIAARYQDAFKGLPLRFHQELENTRHSFWMCSIIVESLEERQSLRQYLAQSGIETRPFFYPAHTLPHYSNGEKFPVAESLSACGINLPSWPGLTQENIDMICQSICGYYQTYHYSA